MNKLNIALELLKDANENFKYLKAYEEAQKEYRNYLKETGKTHDYSHTFSSISKPSAQMIKNELKIIRKLTLDFEKTI